MSQSHEMTELWKRTLALQKWRDVNSKVRERFRTAFALFRERAGILADEIKRSYPTLTVHGISHLDALWDAAETVAGATYPINPAEAFVLGSAFLVHDLGNGLAAYPRGLEDLKQTSQWRDAVGSRIRRATGRPPSEAELESPGETIHQSALEDTMRALHAKHAEKLVSDVTFGSSRFRLLQDDDLREAYGRIIGIIAYSHWWNVGDLQNLRDENLGPPVWCGARDWTIDALKLACLMRTADAAQIDARRAPPFLQALRRPDGLSERHWNFQRRISTKPTLAPGGDRLRFTSSSSFPRSEADSWWLCYDTLSMVDRELRGVDALLSENELSTRPRLAARGIAGVESPVHMMKHIRTEGWSPVDARVQVSDVPAIVTRLGGKELYGSFTWIPLRELIQNGADAIRARRILDQSWNQTSGRITIRVGQEDGVDFCEVIDNGIGMSEQVLTRELLDFGQPFWGTERMSNELPGLNSSTFQSTGEFGIGFFSAFMWGQRVRVLTQRFDKGPESQRVLELAHGASGRPLVRPPLESERLIEPGTSVRVWFDDPRCITRLLAHPKVLGELPLSTVLGQDYEKEPIDEAEQVTIAEVVAWVAPTLDVDLWAASGLEAATCVLKANDWQRIGRERFLTRIYLRKAAKLRVPLLHVVGEGRGILGFDLSSESGPAATIGGLRSQNTGFGRLGLEIAGVYKTTPVKADRSGLPLESLAPKLPKWATELASLIPSLKLPREDEATVAFRIQELGGSTGALEVATVISANGVSRADEATLHAFFRDRRVIFFAFPSFTPYRSLDGILSATGGEPIIGPDYLWRASGIMPPVDGSVRSITHTSVWHILAKAWSCSPSELEGSGAFGDFIRVERGL